MALLRTKQIPFMPFPFYFHFGSFRLTKAHPLKPLELAQGARSRLAS
jgi:hypothetical protein